MHRHQLTIYALLWLATAPASGLADSIISVQDPSITEALSVESLPLDFYTFTPEEYWQEPEDSYWLQFSNWVLGSQRSSSRLVQGFGEWADRTLSGSDSALPDNESYIRIGFATQSEHGDPLQLEPEGRFRLDVPTLEEKLRLVIESESDELIPLEERRRNRQLTDNQRTETDATGALRFLTEVGDAINLSNDVGVRLRLPPDAFWRVKASKRWQLDEDWALHADQRFYYFHQTGWGERTRLSFGRELGKGWKFLASSELEWVHQDRKFVMSQTFNTFKRLNNRATINPRLGILGESQPSWRTTSYFADVTYRYRLYHSWLFGELIPAIEFPRDASFKDRSSLILRIEMYFSRNLD
ncbi:MAG: hypothetical protein R3175_11595 [Marinobacter sp.]|uniref:hypothetical protein n=1 Tax=Marinobacter sp. TaxID=50741 RepID=UPI00299D775A|nr:hypothetical protein [Marinobacter sp.]MDX1756695.1 hypothetical protein [Marinobacter sp.]